MSATDEALVMYPSTLARAEQLAEWQRGAERAILGLRRRLRLQDPSLPNEYDGNSWWPLENEWSAAA